MSDWIVVADDFTGAAELGAIARRRGLTVALTRGASMQAKQAPKADVWVIDTDTRELPAAAANSVLQRCAEELNGLTQSRRVFKKIDSVLRGNCGGESERLARALGHESLLVVAGNPLRHREVRGGKLLVEGVPLDRTVFAEDPTFPARTAEVALLWGARGAAGAVATEIAQEVTEQTLRSLARRVLKGGGLPVGGADFFEACLGVTRGEPLARVVPDLPVDIGGLIVCGSRAGWPERAAVFEARGWPIKVLGTPTPRACEARLLGLGLEPAGEPLRCVRELAQAAVAQRKAIQPGLLCLEGGTTAAAVLAALGWQEFEVLGEVVPGTAVLRACAAETPGWVLVKPGSYPWPEEVMERIHPKVG